ALRAPGTASRTSWGHSEIATLADQFSLLSIETRPLAQSHKRVTEFYWRSNGRGPYDVRRRGPANATRPFHCPTLSLLEESGEMANVERRRASRPLHGFARSTRPA